MRDIEEETICPVVMVTLKSNGLNEMTCAGHVLIEIDGPG